MAEVNSSAVKENIEDQGEETSLWSGRAGARAPSILSPDDFRVAGPTRDAPCSTNRRWGKMDASRPCSALKEPSYRGVKRRWRRP